MKQILNNLSKDQVSVYLDKWFSQCHKKVFSVIPYGLRGEYAVGIYVKFNDDKSFKDEQINLTQNDVLEYVNKYFENNFSDYTVEIFDDLAIVILGNEQQVRKIQEKICQEEKELILQKIENDIKNDKNYIEISRIYDSLKEKQIKKCNTENARKRYDWSNLEQIYKEFNGNIPSIAKHYGCYYSVVLSALKRKKII